MFQSCVSLSVFVCLFDVWFNRHLLRILDLFFIGSAPGWRSGNSVVRPLCESFRPQRQDCRKKHITSERLTCANTKPIGWRFRFLFQWWRGGFVRVTAFWPEDTQARYFTKAKQYQGNSRTPRPTMACFLAWKTRMMHFAEESAREHQMPYARQTDTTKFSN